MWKRLVVICFFLTTTSCVYYNTFYNAKEKFKTAEENQQSSRNQRQQRNTEIPNRAARPTEPAVSTNDKTLYNDAIKKANVVVLYHPDSKYIDDALWMIGKAHYNMNEFISCDKNLKELAVKYPDSKYADDAYFYIGMSQFWLDKYDLALDAFTHLKDLKKSSYKDDALFAIAYMDYLDGNFSSAMAGFEDLIKEYPHSDSSATAQFFVGVCQDSLGQYLNALQSYKEVEKYGPSYDLAFDATYAFGAVAFKADSISLGMSVFTDLAKEERYFDRSSLIRLKLAEGKNLTGNIEDAISEYQRVIEQFPKTDQAAEAYYRLGLLYQDDLDNLEKAKDNFNKATQEKRDSEFRNLALAKAAQITKLETYKSKLGLDKGNRPDSTAPADTLQTPEILSEGKDTTSVPRTTLANPGENKPGDMNALGPVFQEMLKRDNAMGPPAPENTQVDSASAVNPGAPELQLMTVTQPDNADTSATPSADTVSAESEDTEIRFMLAELYHHDLNRPDSALHEYLLLADSYPNSVYAPKALLASAFIYEDKGDTAEAQDIYQRLIDNYPSSNQARYAINKVDTAAIPYDKNVAQMYGQAEDEYFLNNNPQEAIRIFKFIQAAFPKSDFAAKSAYAMAWITAKTQAADGDSSAYRAYQDVVDRYPETVYADKAKIEMGLVKVDKPERKKTQNKANQNKGPEADSLQKANADSLQQYAGTLPSAPPVKDTAEFLYPMRLLNEGHREKGRVIFKVRIDLFGNVIDQQLLGTSGNETIDSVATQTLLNTVFDTSDIADLSSLNDYFRYDIKFEPPQDWEKRYDHSDPYDPYKQQQGGTGP